MLDAATTTVNDHAIRRRRQAAQYAYRDVEGAGILHNEGCVTVTHLGPCKRRAPWKATEQRQANRPGANNIVFTRKPSRFSSPVSWSDRYFSGAG